MRNIKLTLFFIFLVMQWSCTEDWIEEYSDTEFTTADARRYFEENATDLQNVSYGPETRSAKNGNILPNWKVAKTTQTGKITTIEIPLRGDVRNVAQTVRMDSQNKLYGYTTQVFTKLVIQKHQESGVCRQFVVTFVDDIRQMKKENNKNRDYYSRGDYSGYIIISAVTGEYLESFRSVNGKRTRVFIGVGTKADLEDPRNVRLNLLSPDVQATSYTMGEIGGEVVRCSECLNPKTMCTCCKDCDGSGCSSCMVVVYPTCRKCNYTGPGAASGSCNCCRLCHNYPCTCCLKCFPNSCTCKSCIKCQQINCVCDLFSCPNCGDAFCMGGCSSSGGGTTNPEGPGTTIKSNKNLMDQSKFVGLETHRNCKTACDAILAKYGINNPGSPNNVYKLMYETGSENSRQLLKYGDKPFQNYANAVNCIDRHLDAGRPIIVGVDHSPYYIPPGSTSTVPINEGATDHFIVVNGRGYDSSTGKYYYTYYEVGTSYVEKGCDSNANRLIYDPSGPRFYDTVAGAREHRNYNVTQVRPNDGNTTGTIPQNSN